jgi:hypothetical protein
VGYVWCVIKLCGYAAYDSANNEKRAREEEKRQHLHAEKSEFERVFNQYTGPSEALLARLENCNDSPLTVNYSISSPIAITTIAITVMPVL